MVSDLKYEHLAMYAHANLTLTTVLIYRGGELLEYQHNQRFDRIFFDYGYCDLHTEPFSRREPINRYWLELYPLTVFEKKMAGDLMEGYNCSLDCILEIFSLIQNSKSVDSLTYSTYKVLTENRIDFLNLIEKNVAVNILDIEK